MKSIISRVVDDVDTINNTPPQVCTLIPKIASVVMAWLRIIIFGGNVTEGFSVVSNIIGAVNMGWDKAQLIANNMRCRHSIHVCWGWHNPKFLFNLSPIVATKKNVVQLFGQLSIYAPSSKRESIGSTWLEEPWRQQFSNGYCCLELHPTNIFTS